LGRSSGGLPRPPEKPILQARQPYKRRIRCRHHAVLEDFGGGAPEGLFDLPENAAIALFPGCFCLNDRSIAGTGKQRTAGPPFCEAYRHDPAPAARRSGALFRRNRRVGKADGSRETRAR
jgi:hypothetical protein